MHPTRLYNRQLRIEPLEQRMALSVTVDTLVDENDGPGIGTGTSLREAIALASAYETIDFAPELTADGAAVLFITNGQIWIDESLTIIGPGATLLSIDAHQTPDQIRRLFVIDDGEESVLSNVELRGLHLTGGGNQLGSGGAIVNAENLTIVESTLSGNYSLDSGGAIDHSNGTLTILRSTLSGNEADTHGGAVFGRSGSIAIHDSTFTGNRAHGDGGALYAMDASCTISGSTFDNNFAHLSGGALRLGSSTEVLISNSTISGNRANLHAGGMALDLAGGIVARIEHTTISQNLADFDFNHTGSAGGVWQRGDGTVALNHTILAGNDDGTSSEDDLIGAFTARHSIIGVATGSTLVPTGPTSADAQGNYIGFSHAPIDPMLAPLTSYFGRTRAHALYSGSLALDSGDSALTPGIGATPQFDQRGTPFTRVSGARIDIGAYERQSLGISTFVVDTLSDELDGDYSAGDFSLREAINLINGSRGGNWRIQFDSALFSDFGQNELRLEHGELAIRESVRIFGPGSDKLRISATSGRIFSVDDGNNIADKAITISGLTLTGGSSFGGGGAIRCVEQLTVARSIITGNTTYAGEGGGGIVALGGLFLVDSTVSENRAMAGPDGLAVGGGISASGQVEIVNSVIDGNTAVGNPFSAGGGVNAGYLLLRNSRISNNSANSGGAVRAGTLIAMNCDFDGGNIFCSDAEIFDSTISGGGIRASNRVSLYDSTISGNAVGIARTSNYAYPTISLMRCVVTGNGTGIAWPATISQTEIVNNSGYGVFASGGRLTISSSKVSGNGRGGISTNSNAYIDDCEISGNLGPGIRVDGFGSLVVKNTTISGNSASQGGGILIRGGGEVKVEDSTIHGNTAVATEGGAGGGIYADSFSNLLVVNSTISGNRALGYRGFGGGIAAYGAYGSVTIASSTITQNSSYVGGGVWIGRAASFTNSVLSENVADIESDVHLAFVPGEPGIRNSLIGNRLISSIDNQQFDVWSIDNGGNGHYYQLVKVPTGLNWDMAHEAAIALGGHLATITSAAEEDFVRGRFLYDDVAWRNSDGQDIGPWVGGFQAEDAGEPDGGWTWVTGEAFSYSNWNWWTGQPDDHGDEDYLHFVRSAETLFQPYWNDLAGTSELPVAFLVEYDVLPGVLIEGALLGPLADNGGSTRTHALLEGSPLIDAGELAAATEFDGLPEYDQRGFPFARISGGRIDIGAFEYQYISPVLPGDYSGNGVVDAADYAVWRDTLGSRAIPFSGADGNGNGTVDALDYDVWKSGFGNSLPVPTNSLSPQEALGSSSVVVPVRLEDASSQAMTRAPDQEKVGRWSESFPVALVDGLRRLGIDQRNQASRYHPREPEAPNITHPLPISDQAIETIVRCTRPSQAGNVEGRSLYVLDAPPAWRTRTTEHFRVAAMDVAFESFDLSECPLGRPFQF